MTTTDLSEHVRIYLVVQPGMENMALMELYQWWPFVTDGLSKTHEPVPDVSNGGLEFECSLQTALILQKALKIPTRILLRLKTFFSDDLDSLKAFLNDFDFEKFNPKKQRFDVHVISRSSEMFHKKKIEEMSGRILKKRFKNDPPLRLDLRFFRDECTASLDLSGESLHKRGLKLEVGKAPLRETMASAFIRLTLKGISPDQWHNYEFCDPMCGSGTFILEAQLIHEWLKLREFSLPVEFSDHQDHPISSNFALYRLNDKDQQQLKMARQNISLLEIAKEKAIFTQEDLFKMKPLAPARRVVLVNPPFGERIKAHEAEESLKEILDQVARVYGPERIGALYPDRMRYWPTPQGFEMLEFVRMEHGGLPVRFVTWGRSAISTNDFGDGFDKADEL